MTIVDREYLARAAEETIRLIEIARKQARIYPLRHPAVSEVAQNLTRVLEKITAARPTVSLNIAQKEVFLDEVPLTNATLTENEFIELCVAKGVGAITFHAGVTSDELLRFIGLLNERNPALRDKLVQAGVSHIEIGALVSLTDFNALTEFKTPAEQAARNDYDQALDTVWDTFQDLQRGRAVDTGNIELTVRGMVRGLVTDRNVYRRLANIKDYHNYTFNHAVNVAILSLLVGVEVGLTPDQLNRLGVAALLHDAGKLKVPPELLSKPDALSSEEWDIVRKHPVDGARILLDQCGYRGIAITVAFEHHVHYDLSGYPKIESIRKPHLFSRIVGLSDVYDALTSDRSYRKRLMPDTAAAMILSRGGKDFDPPLAKLFVRAVGMYPPDSVVILTNGESAIVCEPNVGEPFRPKVKLTRKGDTMIDLRQTNIRVGKCLDTALSILSSQ
jgi:HD-GYP domain-containing protein (c-di-GMP phosphodiesterase class II)